MKRKTKIHMQLSTKDRNKLKRWLKANDVELWLRRTNFNEARERLQAELDQEVSAAAFDQVRKMECKYWGVQRHVATFEATALSANQWAKLRVGMTQHWDDCKGQTTAFIVEYLRAKGLPINATILRGSSTYDALKGS